MSKRNRFSTPGAAFSGVSRRSVVKAGFAIPFAALLARPARVFAQQAGFDYYISPTGSNSNAGTEGSPWALSALQSKGSTISGKRIGLLPGTYVAPTGASEGDYLRPVVNIVGGSSSAHTVVESVVPRAAIITAWNGSGYNTYVPAPIGTLNQYVTIRGLTIKRVVRKAIMIGNSNVVVEDCEIFDIDQRREPNYGVIDNTEGIRIEDYSGGSSPSLSGIVVRNCEIHDIYNAQGTGTYVPHADYNASGIKIYRTRGLLVEYCTIYNTNEGVFAKTYTGGTTVRYCHFHNLVSATRRLGGNANTSGLSTYVHNNFFYNVTQYYDAEVDQATTHNLYIYNNTAYANRSLNDAGGFYLRSASNGLVRLYNNIVYVDTNASTGWLGIGITDRNNNPAQFGVLDYNCYGGQFRNWASNMYTSLATWRSAMSAAGGAEAHSAASDPLFVSRGANTPANYKLQAGSPCIGAGRIGGVSSGSAVDQGCWTTGVAQIGSDADGSVVRPNPPTLQGVS